MCEAQRESERVSIFFCNKTWWKLILPEGARRSRYSHFSTGMDRTRNKLNIQQTFVNCVDVFWYMNRYSTLHCIALCVCLCKCLQTRKKKDPSQEKWKWRWKKHNLISDYDIYFVALEKWIDLRMFSPFPCKFVIASISIAYALWVNSNKKEIYIEKNINNIDGIFLVNPRLKYNSIYAHSNDWKRKCAAAAKEEKNYNHLQQQQ